MAPNDLEAEDDVSELDPDSFPQEEYSSLKRSLSRIKNTPGYFPDVGDQSRSRTPSAEGMHIHIPRLPMAQEIALASLQYLPTPLLVLSSLKTVVLANESFGRLLGLRRDANGLEDEPEEPVTDVLKGQTLSQIGIDMLSDGVPVWVSWEKFLDNLTAGTDGDGSQLTRIPSGETTPQPVATNTHLVVTPASETAPRGVSPAGRKTTVRDTVVDVLVSTQKLRSRTSKSQGSSGSQSTCRMIISIWAIEGQRFYTLTFTSPTVPPPSKSRAPPTSHPMNRAKSNNSTRSSRSSHSHTPTSSTSSSVVQSPSEGVSSSSSTFLPSGAPAKCSNLNTVTDFQKVTRMKDAMLNAMHIPVIAMWKDESVVFPNPAARRLLAVHADPTTDDSYDFISRFSPWAADFSRQLEEEENPIVTLCRTQQAFNDWQVGLINETTGKKSVYDISGHPVFDDSTGKFFAGLVAFKDVTEYTERIATTVAESEQQFALICDMMPQMLWTTRPDGYHDYFSQRWYDYTGLKPSNSLGLGWKLPFHEEDIPETVKKWKHSLATGEEYSVEYRCQRYDGEWRWMLGRALPLRDNKTGEIVKWFGTCTDIQDIVDARNAGARARQQLLDVLHHSQMNMWAVDRSMRLNFFEGGPWEGMDPDQAKAEFIGKPIIDVLSQHSESPQPHLVNELLSSIERILDGKSELELRENHDKNRWFRSKLVPLRGRRGPRGIIDEHYVEGVIGITTEVTSLRRKEQENIKLLANESAAKEASKMKSSFLANMSHEIRTPIAGVLGMSELLLDTSLDQEQRDFADNIQRSANSLLTVINDILDFSKIESGRLDVEEVQFSLTIVLKDVAKMLSYAAQRKHLDFSSDLNLGTEDLVLLGDPGRVRQILTNLLTNSIKFTSDGSVMMNAKVVEETSEVTTVQFTVEDTGIGIEEDVKQRLFKPFSQADSSTARRFGGTGLGLTICKNLVDLMKGSIELSSRLGSGTKAVFTIPFRKPEYVSGGASKPPLVEVSAFPDRFHSEVSLSCDNSSQATTDGRTPRKLSPPVHSPRSSISMKANRASFPPSRTATDSPAPETPDDHPHILVVEDNPVNQQIAIKFIRSLKRFTVSAVWNGREALEYMLRATSPDITAEEAAQTPIPSLILMDVQMPVLDGYNATHLLRHHHPYASIEAIKRIPIVAMTASAIRGDRERCERAGMDDYLAKPVKRATLEKMILKWIVQADFRRASIPVSDGGKPGLSRTVTGHSSTCSTEYDWIATEYLGARAAVAAATTLQLAKQSMTHAMADANHPGVAPRRASKSKTMIEREMAGLETENERALRREELEEKARTLRDAKLLSVVDDDAGSHLNGGHDTSSSLTKMGVARSYLTQGASGVEGDVLALTEENVEKFNSTVDSNAVHTIPAGGVLDATPANIPGPPPDLDSTATQPQISGRSDQFLSISPTKRRGEFGGLKTTDRSRSDWSASTARADTKRENSG